MILNFFKFSEIFANQGAPLVTTTSAANIATGTSGVVDTGGKFVSMIQRAANLPSVSTTWVANCHRGDGGLS
jgi:hypothetical protein